MAESQGGRWGDGQPAGAMVPMMVLMPERQRAALLGAAPQLEALYDEAMARFDAFCFWYGRPARTRAGLREVAKRLEAYGSPEALRLAGRMREGLAEV